MMLDNLSHFMLTQYMYQLPCRRFSALAEQSKELQSWLDIEVRRRRRNECDSMDVMNCVF
jgi:hypothetical protein